MKIIKVIIYDNPKKSKHRCKARTEGIEAVSKKELEEAIHLLQVALEHYQPASLFRSRN